MQLRIYILVHQIDDHGQKVSVHPTVNECYLKLCAWYHMTPRAFPNLTTANFDHAIILSGIASAMHDHDDGYHIYEQTIDTNQYHE